MGKPCDRHEYQYKFILVGDSGVGKTRLFAGLTGKECDVGSRSTIGVVFGSKLIDHKDITLKAQVLDTTGQERFRSMIRPYYRGLSGALVTFNRSQAETFTSLEWWINELKECCDKEIALILVGHQINLKSPPAVSTEEAQTFADQHNMVYVETSVADSTDFDSSFASMVRDSHRLKMRLTNKDDVTCVRCLRNARKVDTDSESETEELPIVRSSFYV